MPDIGISDGDLEILRPGDGGMDPRALNTLIGQVILRDLPAQHQLQLVDLVEQNLGKKPDGSRIKKSNRRCSGWKFRHWIGVARALAQEGCDLVICGRDRARLAAAREQITAESGSSVLSIQADVIDAASLDAFFETVFLTIKKLTYSSTILAALRRGQLSL